MTIITPNGHILSMAKKDKIRPTIPVSSWLEVKEREEGWWSRDVIMKVKIVDINEREGREKEKRS